MNEWYITLSVVITGFLALGLLGLAVLFAGAKLEQMELAAEQDTRARRAGL